jgi:hypothetical protein
MIFGLGQGVLTGVVGIDAGAEMRVARKLIGQGARPDPLHWPIPMSRSARWATLFILTEKIKLMGR